MAITTFRLCALLLCLAWIGIKAGRSRDGSGANNEHRPLCNAGKADNDSPSRHAPLPRSENHAAGGRKLASSDGLLKYSVFEYCGLLLGTIGNHLSRKRVSGQQPSMAEHDHNVLFVFGDSLFDGGNNKYINNNSYEESNYPYGYTFFTSATGRACDGRIVPDFIAEYAKLPLVPPSMQPGADFSYGANFASGGSAVLDSYGATNINVINLKEQLRQFKEMVRTFNEALGPDGAREMLRKAVYIFSAGGNDYLHYYAKMSRKGRVPTPAEQRRFVKDVVGNTTNAILEIYEQGARKIAFQNVGPIGCLPSVDTDYPKLNGSCAPELLSMPMLHNEELYGALTDLAIRLEGFKFSVMDYFSSLYDRMMNPFVYGFNFGRTACYRIVGDAYRGAMGCTTGNRTLCEYPSAYLFFDEGHTTQSANEQLAKLIWSGDPSVTRPHNVEQLFEDED